MSGNDLSAEREFGVLRSTGKIEQKPRLTVSVVAAASLGIWRKSASWDGQRRLLETVSLLPQVLGKNDF